MKWLRRRVAPSHEVSPPFPTESNKQLVRSAIPPPHDGVGPGMLAGGDRCCFVNGATPTGRVTGDEHSDVAEPAHRGPADDYSRIGAAARRDHDAAPGDEDGEKPARPGAEGPRADMIAVQEPKHLGRPERCAHGTYTPATERQEIMWWSYLTALFVTATLLGVFAGMTLSAAQLTVVGLVSIAASPLLGIPLTLSLSWWHDEEDLEV